jgi:glycosyltransferase involved in cell wall biosynthesis
MSQQPAEGLSFLLPVHNQAAVLEHALSSWSHLLAKLERPYEILLIDDGSTDATKKMLDGGDGVQPLSRRVPELQVLSHSEYRGFGAALRTGLNASRYPLIFYTGLDYAYNPTDLRTLLQRINDGDPESGRKIDAVTGYRSGTPLRGWPKWRNRIWRGFLRVTLGLQAPAPPGWLGYEAHGYSRLIRMMFGLRVGDVDSKFKLFRRKIFDRIPIQSDGDFVHAEILVKANFLGCLMDEVPIAARPGAFAALNATPSPVSRGKELRRVFFSPDFGPAPAATSKPAGVEPDKVAVQSESPGAG